MNVSALYATPISALAAVVMVAVLGSLELGHRLGRSAPAGEKQFATISSSILAPVGLLLAFSFSLAESRQMARREAVVREANSIGTFWLRTALLPEPVRGEMRVRLRRYVDLHFEHREGRIDEAYRTELEAEASRLQKELWALLMREAHRAPDSLSLLLAAPALNALIDDAESVLAARENRLLDSIFAFLFALIAFGAATVGYGARAEKRNGLLWLAFAVVLGGVLLVLLDMDRPRRGLILTGIEPYVRLRASMQGD
jgi:hypothetical protein